MMNRETLIRSSLVVTLLVGLVALTPAQSETGYNTATSTTENAPSRDSDGGLMRVEELYLSERVSMEVAATQIRTGSREIRLLAIRTIEEQINRGTIDPASDDVFQALEPAVNGGVLAFNHSVERSLHIHDPMVRREAVRVMGLLGTERAQARLVKLVLNDPEPLVRVQALRGIAGIAIDPTGEVSRAVARAILREQSGGPHQETVLSAVIALDALASNRDNTVHESAREMLVQAASDGRFIQIVRRRALEALSRM